MVNYSLLSEILQVEYKGHGLGRLQGFNDKKKLLTFLASSLDRTYSMECNIIIVAITLILFLLSLEDRTIFKCNIFVLTTWCIYSRSQPLSEKSKQPLGNYTIL